jgi:hypothetical protein
MRRWWVALVALLAGIASADKLGLTDDAILKMGRAGWGKYYAERRTESEGPTVSWGEADREYAKVLRRRNHRYFQRLGPVRRAALLDAEKALVDLNAALISCATDVSGGFLWPYGMGAASGSDVQEAMWASLHARAEKRVSADDVRREMHRLGLEIVRQVQDPKAGKDPPGDPQFARDALTRSRRTFARLERAISKLSRPGASCILAQAREVAREAADYAGFR